MISAFILDDERLSVGRLEHLLRRLGNVRILGTSTDPVGAIDQIATCAPDVLFVDVEMPKMSGFGVIEALSERASAPVIVLVTGFPKFAARAFDWGVTDFVTKPVDADRLRACVKRVGEVVRSRLHDEARASAEAEPKILWVQRRGSALKLDLNRLDRAAAEVDYVRLFIEGREHLHRGSMTALAAMLDSSKYLRVHRSHIVRIASVRSVHRSAAGKYSIVLDSGVTIPVGRIYRSAVRALSGKAAARGTAD